MITLTFARMLVAATDRLSLTPATGDAPAAGDWATGAAPHGLSRLLPAALRRRLAARAANRQLARAIRRLDELSPHLLDDIGMAHVAFRDMANPTASQAITGRAWPASRTARQPRPARPADPARDAIPAAAL